ncbi:LysR family transcriptional regulator [Pusillimonas sp. MFBS29]|uniref:LysR family transcriptional regulator n=1 Tax=Pusillimonas sp. MFBS29 TaxID=2886690 RepID=UPI001D0F766C|nr:LysR family transcriptional regulator [Pusillimonas sp. MFBS29]MCC2595750.1 LysR family transcriptional regulator [Pusillimonas sp. MFBS29]
MAVSLRQFQQLIAIAEFGTFRRAAEALFIAQPALSVSIQKLEQEVGVQLLDRGARGVTLTPAGEAMLEDARAALFYADQSCRTARLVALGEWGSLRLGFVGSATYALLPLSLNAFRSRYPNVKLELREDSSLGLMSMIRSHQLDAGLVRGPIADDPALESWVIQRDDLVLAVPSRHRFASQRAISLEQCRSEDFVIYASTIVPGLHSVALTLCLAAGFTPRIKQEAIQVQTLVSLVASGLGVALVPGVTRSYASDHVRFIELSDPAARNCLSLLLLARRDTRSPLVAYLRDSMLTVGRDDHRE